MLWRGELPLTLSRREVPGRLSPLRGWGHIGCESDEALPKSVSHTLFHLSLLFGGGCADIEEHNNPSKVEMTPLWRLFDRS